MRKSTIKLGSH